jgi:hypothetical protein
MAGAYVVAEELITEHEQTCNMLVHIPYMVILEEIIVSPDNRTPYYARVVRRPSNKLTATHLWILVLDFEQGKKTSLGTRPRRVSRDRDRERYTTHCLQQPEMS